MALQRKKVTVRTKRGKVYQRSVMVRAGQPTRRTVARAAIHAFGHGLISGTVGGAVSEGTHLAGGGWFGGKPSVGTRVRGAVFGAASSSAVGSALLNKTRSGRMIRNTVNHGSMWQRAAIAASGTVGAGVGVTLGTHLARKASDRIMRPHINSINEAVMRYAKTRRRS